MAARSRIRSLWLSLFFASLVLGCSSPDEPPDFTVQNDGGGTCGSRSCADAGPRGGSKAPPSRGGGGSSSVDPVPPPKMPEPPPPRPVPICTPQVPLAPSCAGCVCSTTPECASAVTECDASCWSLLSCAYEHCLPDLDAECLETECPEHSSAMESALAAMTCTSRCYGSCIYDLQQLGMDDMDAGL